MHVTVNINHQIRRYALRSCKKGNILPPCCTRPIWATGTAAPVGPAPLQRIVSLLVCREHEQGGICMVCTYCTVCAKIYLFSYENRIFFCFAVPSLQPPIKSYAPIESVVRKPTTIAQVPSASHVTTGINSVQLMTSHNPTASVAVVNMGKYFYHLYLQIGQ